MLPSLQSHLEGVPVSLQLVVGFLIVGFLYKLITSDRPYAGLPVVTLQQKGWWRLLPVKWQWVLNGKELLATGLREHSGPFQVMTGSGPKIVLPNRFAEELRNHTSLNFNEAFAKDFFVHYPGFDGQRQGLQDETFIQEVVRVKLTQSLGLITDDLVEECDASLHEILGDNKQWQTKDIKEDVLDVVARLSSRVFLGKELCRNQEWLRISKNYTVDSFMAANYLRLCPDIIRPIVYWLIPTCTRIRQEVRDANRLIYPEVERRRKNAEKALEAGEKPAKAADAIGWMVEVSRGREVDYVAGQLALSLAAIHTTSETLTKTLITLCEEPKIAENLREEILQVLRTEGWSKVSLYKMKLLDSFLKESQRLDGLSFTSMNRKVKQPITLSDGTVLPNESRIMISDDKVNDPETFPNPKKFDATRFLHLRQQPGEENRHQYVTTTSDHMGFGHGSHACPGRFFASNEIKIALCFLLLRYDFKFLEGEGRPKDMEFESAKTTMPGLKLQVRRRSEELDLMSPQA
ncbi:cytochrome P450 [Polychaeton citri CBS 116435]|uniref:Cytochrome P450 n=1 Tax=Polychaeton citri CBS 116435 TaxID=1314669 RepID=A0A9P4UNJ7_9PEZI|nr:cytochrome P450 [Polychaeton citri CBS 116435]